MCTEGDPVIIVITDDADLYKGILPPVLKDVCVQHVTYKPVDLRGLMQKIADAVERAEVRKQDGE
jgi:hypothetical protein